jgi:rifampicin phosphotransferase
VRFLDGVAPHLDELGNVAVAVRSSALDEDGATASFAGIYDSVVDVRGVAAVEEAIAKVRASALSPRALAYRCNGQPVQMAVVVQRLVRADCAGVLFTADPVTGDRDARVVTAVRGLGEALVSGEQDGEEWLVRGSSPLRRRALPEPVLTEDEVRALVALGDRVAAHFGAPQDIEWVMEQGRIALVQARPITALPERIEWTVPHETAALVRNFRWGEWLSDPVSPLFASWFLPRASDILTKRTTEVFGMRPPPPTYALVNGWYFFAPLGAGGVGTLLAALVRKPRVFLLAKRAADDPVAGVPLLVEPYRRAYEDDLAPRHRALAAEHLGRAPAELIDYVERACVLHGDLMFNITFVGGSAWKIEAALARRCAMRHARSQARRHGRGWWPDDLDARRRDYASRRERRPSRTRPRPFATFSTSASDMCSRSARLCSSSLG